MKNLGLKKQIRDCGVLFLFSLLLHLLFAWGCRERTITPGINLEQLFFAICLIEGMIAGGFLGFFDFMDDSVVFEREEIPVWTTCFVLLGGILGSSFMVNPMMATISQDGPVFIFGICLSALVAVMFGMICSIFGHLFGWVIDKIITMTEKTLSLWNRVSKKVKPSLR